MAYLLNKLAGANTSNGGTSEDFALGGAGSDTPRGSNGDDTLNGGNDAEQYVSIELSGTDTIAGLRSGLDRIDLSEFNADANITAEGCFIWIGIAACQLRTYTAEGDTFLASDLNSDDYADFTINLGRDGMVLSDLIRA